MESRIIFDNLSALVAVGADRTAIVVSHSGGDTEDGEYNFWKEEISVGSCDFVDDLMGEIPPKEPGMYVWEGHGWPEHDDAPTFVGKFRPATAEDFKSLLKMS
jgi:hypothetical protein